MSDEWVGDHLGRRAVSVAPSVCESARHMVFTWKHIATASSPSHLHHFNTPAAPATRPFLFEEIRSRWEAAQILSDEKLPKMVGRKEKPVDHHPLNGGDETNGKKFRRKLSHGLSLISLGQRKTTPVHPPLPSTDLSSASDVPYPHESSRLMSPMHDLAISSSPAVHRVALESNHTSQKGLDPDAKPKRLPRSRTMSFIPRPSRNDFESSVTDSDLKPTPHPAFTIKQKSGHVPSKIPSPDRSVTPRRSPRQYIPNLTTQQAKHVAAGNAFAGVDTPSPSKASVRSYTTPNLTKAAHSPGPNNFMAPRRPDHRRLSGIPAPQRPNVKENTTPVGPRHIKRLSNIQEHSPQSLKRESAKAPTGVSKRRSTGPASTLAPGKQGAFATPPSEGKRKNSYVVTQTPLAAQRALPKHRSPLNTIDLPSTSNGITFTRARLLGPVSPPTPPKTADHGNAPPQLPRANTEKDLRKRTFSTPYKRMGGGILARSQAGANSEVRLPRSPTYHYLVRRPEDIPPVPTIPEKFKSTSMPVLVQPPVSTQPEKKRRRQTSVHQLDSGEISLYSPKGLSIVNPEMCGFAERKQSSVVEEVHRPKPSLLPKSKSKLRIQIPDLKRTFSATILVSAKSNDLPSSKSANFISSADIGISMQVKDYMPALYWAGRFQTRYDRWRTEAMQVELDPSYSMEGPLANWNLEQENVAACHIFLQLRDLCLSNQAADSLWEFEHTYRKEHGLLGTSCLPPLNPKPNDGTPRQGSFGRAVRKMTPRKVSLVNLLKGKGWSTEESKAPGSAGSDLTSAKIY